MRRPAFRVAPVLVGIATALVVATPLRSQVGPPPATQLVNGREAAAREVLVRFRESAAADPAGIDLPADVDRIEPVGRSGLYRIRSRSVPADRLLAFFSRHPAVDLAEPNYVIRTFARPNDPEFPRLWGLENAGQIVNGGAPGLPGADVKATAAWDVSTGSAATVVAIVDTGIDYTHPDLAANVWSAPAPFTVVIGGQPITCPAGSYGFNVLTRTCDPRDDHGHGTHVSGTIGAVGNNGIGVAGVNWVTRMMAIKVFDATGSGTTADAVNGIEFALQARQAFAASGDADIRVLSNSWGGFDFSQALLDAIVAAGNQGMLFVAAAGNSGLPNDTIPTYPASYNAPNVISVAATTNADARAWFSNYGAVSVDLGAPGVDVLSTLRDNAYGFSSGTSMATPHVSGAAALVLSRCALDTAQLRETILGTVEPVAALSAITATGGRLDVNRAIRACTEPPETPSSLSAVAGDGQVALAWSGATNATSYRVRRGLAPGGPYAVVASGVLRPSYTDLTAANGTTYYYVVSATNPTGESANSNEVSATPRAASDLVVSALTVPSTAGAGGTIAVSVTTANQGAGASDPYLVRFYLSSNYLIDPGTSCWTRPRQGPRWPLARRTPPPSRSRYPPQPQPGCTTSLPGPTPTMPTARATRPTTRRGGSCRWVPTSSLPR